MMRAEPSLEPERSSHEPDKYAARQAPQRRRKDRSCLRVALRKPCCCSSSSWSSAELRGLLHDHGRFPASRQQGSRLAVLDDATGGKVARSAALKFDLLAPRHRGRRSGHSWAGGPRRSPLSVRRQRFWSASRSSSFFQHTFGHRKPRQRNYIGTKPAARRRPLTSTSSSTSRARPTSPSPSILRKAKSRSSTPCST